MMDKSFVEAIRSTAETKVVTVNGKEYTSRKVENVPLPEEPTVEPIVLETLTGLVDYCNASTSVDKLRSSELLIHICSHTEVKLVSKIVGEHRKRDVFAIASIENVESFSFGEWLSHPAFMIGLQAHFLDYGDKDKVLRVLGTIKDEAVRTSNDDGTTQRVTATAGVVLAQDVAVPNPVMLQPYRTFTEVLQPPSQFILRVRQTKGQMPDVALFEADGGQWRRDALRYIRDYLGEKITDIPILA